MLNGQYDVIVADASSLRFNIIIEIDYELY